MHRAGAQDRVLTAAASLQTQQRAYRLRQLRQAKRRAWTQDNPQDTFKTSGACSRIGLDASLRLDRCVISVHESFWAARVARVVRMRACVRTCPCHTGGTSGCLRIEQAFISLVRVCLHFLIIYCCLALSDPIGGLPNITTRQALSTAASAQPRQRTSGASEGSDVVLSVTIVRQHAARSALPRPARA